MGTVQAFIEDCMNEGMTGNLRSLIEQKRVEMTDKGYVKNKEGFWVKESDFEYNGTNQKKHD